MKKLFTAVSFAALMAVPAVAQDTNAPDVKNAPPAVEQPRTAPAAPSEKMTNAAYSGQISASELLDETIVNAANESVGDVNDVLIDSSGKVAAVIVGVGGFLGIGEKDVALTFDQLSFASNNDNDLVVMTNATKESLQAAPERKKAKDRS